MSPRESSSTAPKEPYFRAVSLPSDAPSSRFRAPCWRIAAALLVLVLGGPALTDLCDDGSSAARAQEEEIDWARARELHEKVRRGETLTAEEQEYYAKAQAARREQRATGGRRSGGGQRSGRGDRSAGGSGSRGATTGDPGAAVLRASEPWDENFLPAFPGAEGAGAPAIGGRGGKVLHVTNLDDHGSGSLRAAVEGSGPRIIVFDVAGTIEIGTPLQVDDPFLTIAGQTAPGGGITLKAKPSLDTPLIRIRTHDVVIRYLRFRPGPGARGSMQLTGISIAGATTRNIMIDHVSISWTVDKGLAIFQGARNVTVQWSILAETLYCSNHGKTVDPEQHGARKGSCPGGGDPHSRAVTISSVPGDRGVAPGDLTLHHNLFAHNNRRHPNVVSAGPVAFINNVIYNLGNLGANLGSKPGSNSGATLDYIGNFIKPGPNTDRSITAIASPRHMTYGVSVYTEGNVGADSIGGLTPASFSGLGFLSDKRWNAAPVTETSAEEAYGAVLASAGSRLPKIDAVDERILADVRDGTGGFVNDPSEVGGWPRLEPGTPPVDRDRDGMPAEWEARCDFLDDGNRDDSVLDEDGDGYTEIEEYLHCLVVEGSLAQPASGCSCNESSTLDPNR